MPSHDRHDSIIDQRFIHFTEGSIPFLTVVFVDSHDQVLVVLLCAVSGEMFHAGGNILCPHPLKECF